MPPNASTEGHLVKGSRRGFAREAIFLPFGAIAHHPRHADGSNSFPDRSSWLSAANSGASAPRRRLRR
jgi:hypothetical protein